MSNVVPSRMMAHKLFGEQRRRLAVACFSSVFFLRHRLILTISSCLSVSFVERASISGQGFETAAPVLDLRT